MEKKYNILNPIKREDCVKCENSKDRKQFLKNNGLCEKNKSAKDFLPIRCVGSWAHMKIYYLNRYFSIFCMGMKNHWNKKLNYIEICSGPGRCVLKDEKIEIDGTPMRIINNENVAKLNKALFFDIDNEIVQVLNERIEKNGKKNIGKALVGDYNKPDDIIRKINENIRQKGLTLFFIDPTDCGVPLEFIKKMKKTFNKADFIINVAHGMDSNRNLVQSILDSNFIKAKEKYIKFLGNENFFNDKQNIIYAKNGNNVKLINRFLNTYKKSLTEIGLKYTDQISVKHYYKLLFATSHERGLDFWKKITKIDSFGQQELF